MGNTQTYSLAAMLSFQRKYSNIVYSVSLYALMLKGRVNSCLRYVFTGTVTTYTFRLT